MWGSIIKGVASFAGSLFSGSGGSGGSGQQVVQANDPDDISTVLDRVRRTHKSNTAPQSKKTKQKGGDEIDDLMQYFMRMASNQGK